MKKPKRKKQRERSFPDESKLKVNKKELKI